MATLDELIHQVGSWGLFQAILLVAIHATRMCSVWGMLFMAFGGLDPGWSCLDGDTVAQANTSQNTSVWFGNTTTPAYLHGLANTSDDQCDIFASCRHVSFHPGSSTVVSEWGLVCDRQWVPSFMFTVQSLGMMVGSYVQGHLGDCIGRRTSHYSMVALLAVTNLAAVFSPTWQAFTAVRFFIGWAVGGILSTVITLPIEFLGPLGRVVSCGLPTWSIGGTLFSVSLLVLRDWRKIHILAAVMSTCTFLLVFWVPESMRWLAVHGKDARAATVAARIAKMNGRPPPSSELLASVADSERRMAQNSGGGQYSYMDLLVRGGKQLRKQAIFMAIIWFCLALVYFGITFGIKGLYGDFYINYLIFSVGELPGLLFVVPALKYLGRRWGIAAHFLVAAFACLMVLPVTLILGNDNDSTEGDVNEDEILKGKIIMGLALIAKLLVLGAWNATNVFTGELFPTVVRSMAYGFINGSCRVGSLIGPILVPQQAAYLHLLLSGMGVLLLLCTALVLALPETKGKPLEDTLDRTRTVKEELLNHPEDYEEKKTGDCSNVELMPKVNTNSDSGDALDSVGGTEPERAEANYKGRDENEIPADNKMFMLWV